MNKLLIGIVAVFLILPTYGWAQEKAVKKQKDIEMFLHGKRYGSMHEYKIDKIKNNYRQRLTEADQQDLDNIFDHIVKGLSSHNKRDLNEYDVEEIIFDLKAKKIALQKKPKSESDFSQMQKMLDDYMLKTDNSQPYQLDSSRMKTIVISPK